MAAGMTKLGDLVTPLINMMCETELSCNILQMVETSLQVLREDVRPAQAKSYTWVSRGGPLGQRIILFGYADSRASVALQMRIHPLAHIAQ